MVRAMFEEPYFFPTVSRLRTLQPSAFSRATFSAAAFWAAIGTVQGDLHDIGKNLVAMILQNAGFEVRDLGTNVSAEGSWRLVRGRS